LTPERDDPEKGTGYFSATFTVSQEKMRFKDIAA